MAMEIKQKVNQDIFQISFKAAYQEGKVRNKRAWTRVQEQPKNIKVFLCNFPCLGIADFCR